MLGGSCSLGPHGSPHKHSMGPVPSFHHERNTFRPPAAQQDGRYRDTFGALPLAVDYRALGCWGAESGWTKFFYC